MKYGVSERTLLQMLRAGFGTNRPTSALQHFRLLSGALLL